MNFDEPDRAGAETKEAIKGACNRCRETFPEHALRPRGLCSDCELKTNFPMGDINQKLLEAHRRFHAKAGCPGSDDCYVCALEKEQELLKSGDPLSGGDYQEMQSVRAVVERTRE